MTSYSDRTRDILEKARRERAKQRKNLVKATLIFACVALVAVVTMVVVLFGSAFTPVSGDNSSLSELSLTPSMPDDKSNESDIDEISDESNESSDETSEPVVIEPTFEESKKHLIETSGYTFEIPENPGDSAFADALANAKGAFEGTIKYFGDKVETYGNKWVITLYVNVTYSLSKNYSGTVVVKCPHFYLMLLDEETEYIFLDFDNPSDDGSAYFAVIPKQSLNCLVDDTKTQEITSLINSDKEILVYLSAEFKKTLSTVDRINSTELPYTMVLTNDNGRLTVVRDKAGMAVSVETNDGQRLFYRLAGKEDIFEADLLRMKLKHVSGFDYPKEAFESFGIFINALTPTFSQTPALYQFETKTFDFTDGNVIYSIRLEGTNPSVVTANEEAAVEYIGQNASLIKTTPEGFDTFDTTRENVLEYFGVTDIPLPAGLDMTINFAFDENISVFSGYITSFGEGIKNGDAPEYVYININPVNVYYGSKKTTLKVPAYFVTRLNNDNEFLFYVTDGEIAMPAAILEISSSGRLSSPLGRAFNATPNLTTVNQVEVHYHNNHFIADEIKNTVIKIGKSELVDGKFVLVYTPAGTSSEAHEVMIIYEDGLLTIQITLSDGENIMFYREKDGKGVYRLDENGEKEYVASAEYTRYSSAISYMISVTALTESPDTYVNTNEYSYRTMGGNKVTFVIEKNKLAAIKINNQTVAAVIDEGIILG